VEEEVAAVEDDEVVHKGPDKKGRVLWVMSHRGPLFSCFPFFGPSFTNTFEVVREVPPSTSTVCTYVEIS
jgi:hypothetical protein